MLSWISILKVFLLVPRPAISFQSTRRFRTRQLRINSYLIQESQHIRVDPRTTTMTPFELAHMFLQQEFSHGGGGTPKTQSRTLKFIDFGKYLTLSMHVKKLSMAREGQ
ncbi:hypothetical protein V6N11_066644 [Hibiscus sabdariffa]|uniref:Uncharacterized protein n=1 Tax=Hibiscus sabdariffa TaxID=183260 RepID=A0ABR2AGH7_9ROSI